MLVAQDERVAEQLSRNWQQRALCFRQSREFKKIVGVEGRIVLKQAMLPLDTASARKRPEADAPD